VVFGGSPASRLNMQNAFDLWGATRDVGATTLRHVAG